MPRCFHFVAVWALPLVLLVPSHPALADPALIGVGRVAGTASDRSELKGRYVDAEGTSIPANQFGSFGSGLTYLGTGQRYYAVNDRGLGDGKTPSVDRLHLLEIAVDARARTVTPRLLETVLLTDEKGRNFIGLSSAFSTSDPAQGLRFDPEGIRVDRDGRIFISDEYGPFVYEFDRRGRKVRAVAVPAKFLIAHPSDDEETEIRSNTLGRVSNKGMEGLAISPDGRALYGIMQCALIQDGGRKGLFSRILKIGLDDGSTREYVYPLATPKMSISEILAIDDHRFLVMERDSKPGKKGIKKIFAIDLAKATDVSDTGTTPSNGLPPSALPAHVKAAAKRLFLDLAAPKYGLANDLPAKIEGLTWGPDLPDGHRLLLVASDNDLKPTYDTFLYAFGVDRADLDARP